MIDNKLENIEKNKNQSTVSKIGIKGVFLQDMFDAKVLVPPGFIMTQAFQKFMEQTGLFARIETIIKVNNILISDINSILLASNEITQFINDTEFPKELELKILHEFSKLKANYVAVRPSLTTKGISNNSILREFPSVLNVSRETLMENIKKTWAAFYSPASISYRLKKKIDMKKPLAVILIQQMVDAEISGTCFTVHPITRDKNQIVIEASFGLSREINKKGEAPDTYIINKDTWEILGKTIVPQDKMLARVGSNTKLINVDFALRKRQKLSSAQILALANLAKRIEFFYEQVPQKVEWVLKKNNFYIIQSQPISKA